MVAEAQSLGDFINAMKKVGASDDFVVSLLRQNGWSEKRIYQAFGSWYETSIGQAVPNGGGRIETAKDAFLYLLAFITLGIWAIQLGSLMFHAIERSFPNPALDSFNSIFTARTMADELASIIVAFPLFLLVSRAIVRGVQGQPERLESSARKWLTYIALVITASTMISDVVTFFAYFLRGDLTVRFALKVLAVLIIATGIFTYYLDSLQRARLSSARNRFFVLAALAVVSVGVVVGFLQIGSPSAQRSAMNDARRLSDFSSIAQGLHSKWQAEGPERFMLPPTIQDLTGSGIAPGTSILDSVSGRSYSYTPLKGTAYRLCATFARPSSGDVPIQWQHASGSVCFALDASQLSQQAQGPW